MERQDPSSWIIDIDDLTPDTVYEICVSPPMGDSSKPVLVRTLPYLLGKNPLEIILFSCYFPSEEYWEHTAHAKAVLQGQQVVPHVKIFAGDQIYGDVPASSDPVTAIYRERYSEACEANRLGDLFAYGANLFTCDDHEFWNSYPESMWWLSRTYDGNWREARDEAIRQFYQHQGILNFGTGFSGGAAESRCWCVGKLSGLDLFVTDTRTDRADRGNQRCSTRCGNAPSVMSSKQLDSLLTWIRNVERIGLLVLGQPLWSLSESYDNALCDYSEFDRILDALAKEMRERDVTYIVLTGDIHWGRLTILQNSLRPASKLIEFVSSPIARVGMRSIFSRRFGVGDRPEVDFSFDAQPGLKAFFGSYEKHQMFATNENNFGRLSLSSSLPGSVKARFELWSLDSQCLARDRWSSWNNRCGSTIDLRQKIGR